MKSIHQLTPSKIHGKKSLKTSVKAKIALVSSALLLAFSAHSADKNFDNLHKQLAIMNDIMMSSAKVEQNPNQALIRSIDSVYLQGQGAIFTVKSAHGGSSHRQFFQMIAPKPPKSPKAPKSMKPPKAHVNEHVIISDDDDFVFDFSEHEDEFDRVIEIFERQREGARELRSEQRDIAYEMRDIAREVQDIEYQLQRAEKESKQALTAELKKLEHQRVALDKNRANIEQKVAELNKQRAQQKMAQNKARTAHFGALNEALVETLCLYGNGLQAVPSDEHISLIIKDAGDKQRSGYKDQIMVFSKKDISACSSSKLTSQKLLAKAAKYQF